MQRQASPDAAAGLSAGAGTILLAEDEPLVRRMVREILRLEGYTVLEASEGNEALTLCERHEGVIDLLVTDVVMPGMNGRELAERVARWQPGTRVLFMSGYTDDMAVHHGICEVESAYLQKPFTATVLMQKVRAMLSTDRSTSGQFPFLTRA